MNLLRCTRLAYVFALFLLFLAFLLTFPAVSQALSVVQLGDYDNISVMEVSGDFSALNATGQVNAMPRQAVAREFYRNHGDDYDFLVLFTDFDYAMPPGAKAFYLPVRNDVEGIGLEAFDQSQLYASDGAFLDRLAGVVEMGHAANHELEPADPGFEKTLLTLTHEMLHRWGAYVRFMDDTQPSDALLGPGNAHWSFLLDASGSSLYGNRWRDNGDGTYTSIPPEQAQAGAFLGRILSPLELYLMGLAGRDEVPPLRLIISPGIDRNRLPEVGVTIPGTLREISIDQIIAAEGERFPATVDVPRDFRLAFVYAVAEGTWSPEDPAMLRRLAEIKTLQREWETRFAILTGGVAQVKTQFIPQDTVATNPGLEVNTVNPAVAPSVSRGVNWLVTRRGSDGSWQDQSGTAVRDTASAVRALKPFPAGATSAQAGEAWLTGASPENHDYYARTLLAIAAGDPATLIALQNADGGWGVGPGYRSNPVDTALALRALTGLGSNSTAVINAAINFLHNTQNPDGGWNVGHGASMVQPTAYALLALNDYRDKPGYTLEPTVADGMDWLNAKQNPDGGFGNSPSTVYDTAAALSALKVAGASQINIDNAINYLLNSQADSGSWHGSAFQTALAVEALYAGQVATDLTISDTGISISPYPINSVPSAATVLVKVTNVGEALLDQVKVVLFEGNPELNVIVGESIVSIAGHATIDVGFPVQLTAIGNANYYASVDPDGVIPEVSEYNNLASKEFYVGPPPPIVGFSASASSGSESQTVVNLTVDLSYAWNETVSVDYRAVATGTATLGVDYNLSQGTLLFAPGETSKIITVEIVNDLILESSETLICELNNPQNGFLGNAQHIYTILDNDEPPVVYVNGSYRTGSEKTPNVSIPVFLSFAWDRDVLVNYSVKSTSTASVGEDFTISQGPLLIPAGQASGSIELSIIDDTLLENNETIYVELTNPVNAVLGQPVAQYIIIDNDALPSVAIHYPKNDVTYNLRSISLSFSTNNSVTRTLVFIDGEHNASAGHGSMIGPLAYGQHTIRIEVYNDNNVMASSEVTFFIDDAGLPPGLVSSVNSHGFGKFIVGEDGGLYGKEYLAKYDINWNKLWGLTSSVADFTTSSDNIYSVNNYKVKIYRLDGVLKSEFDIPFYGNRIVVDKAGNILLQDLVSVDVKGNSPSQYDVVVYKYDQYGRFVTKTQFGSTANEQVSDIAVDGLGNVYVLGTTEGYVGTSSGANHGGTDIFVAKISENFNSMVVKQFGTSLDETANELGIDSQNNVYAVASTPGTFDGIAPVYDKDAVLFKLSTNFDLIWIHQEHSLCDSLELFVGTDDFVYVAGRFGDYDPRYQNNYMIKVIKYDQNKSLQWSLDVFGEHYNQIVGDLYVDSSNNIYISAGYLYPNYSTGYWENRVFFRQYGTGIESPRKPVITVTPVDEEPGRTEITLTGTRESEATVTVVTSAGGVVGAVIYPTPTTWSCLVSGMAPGRHSFSITAMRSDGETNQTTYEYEVFSSVSYLTSWVKQYGTIAADHGKRLLPKGDQIQFFGETAGIMGTQGPGSSTDLFVLRADTHGNPLAPPWQIDAGGGGAWDSAVDSAIDSAGNTYILWSTSNKGSIAKYDGNGSEVWRDSIDSRVTNFPTALALDLQGNVYVAGYTYASLKRESYGGGADYFVVKYDNQGRRVWTRLSGEPATVFVNDLVIDGSGFIYLVGHESDGYVHNLPVVYKLSNSGAFVAKKVITPQNGKANAIIADNIGNLYIAGQANYMRGTADDPFIVKMSSNLTETWQRNLFNKDADSLVDLQLSSNGDVVAVGITKRAGYSDDAYFLVLDAYGNPRYSRYFSSSSMDSFNTVMIDNSGAIYAGGNTSGQLGERIIGGQDVFVAKLTPATGPELTVTEYSSPTNVQAQRISGTISSGATFAVSVSAPPGSSTVVSSVSQNLDGTWSFMVNNLMANADNVLALSATDAVGSASRTITITVDTLPPTLTIDPIESPTSQNSQTLSGSVEDGATLMVEVYPPSFPLPVPVTSGTWSYLATALAPGDNVFTFTASDSAGNTTTRSATISYEPPPPLSLMVTPAFIAENEGAEISLVITNVNPPGTTVAMEQVLDLNQNGVTDPGEPLVRRFLVTDGGVPVNPNLAADTDGLADGAITTRLNAWFVNDRYHAAGQYVFTARTATESDAESFSVVETVQPQSLSGNVRDAQGGAVSGALVELRDAWGRSFGFALSDVAGQYRFNVESPGEYVSVPMVQGYVYDRATAQPVAVPAGQAVVRDLTLADGVYQVTGKVLDGTTLAGLPGVLVHAESSQYIAAAMTAADGSYSLSLPGGDYGLTLEARPGDGLASYGYLASSSPQRTIQVNGDLANQDLLAASGASLVCGAVNDAVGVAVKGAPVQAYDAQGSAFSAAISDGQGQYCMALTAGGDWQLAIDDSLGHGVRMIGTLATATAPNLMGYAIDGWVGGAVLDENTQPVGDVLLEVSHVSGVGAAVLATADGHYLLGLSTELAGDWSLTAHSDAHGYEPIPSAVVSPVSGQTLVRDFTLTRAVEPVNSINVTNVSYHSKKKTLTVYATSALGASANLTLNVYGAMTWNKKFNRWEKVVANVASKPATVTVSGPEGSVTVPVN